MENTLQASSGPTPATLPASDVPLVDIPVTDDNVALNILVAYCSLGNKRGAFNLQESAKIWEAVQRFSQPPK
jgi:hypothetical protein